MPETRDALFVLVAGAGFFVAMYQWVTMIAETMPLAVLPLHVLVFVHGIEQLQRLRFNYVLGLIG